MVDRKPPLRRCAVYTRASTEEGLDQDFNSLDAQREACEAFVRSQVGEGWKLIPTHYDDGGYSGGSMDRPALKHLLADIEAGRIDTVVVYKVDRLTRSLSDFARIVDVFDDHGVSFVSVTQQFNTTTSMGRLTLNMLLSFAQFEREVTGERIRDKIAASKRKGMWMGGRVPLGYEPNGRTLVIDEPSAKTVRTIFRLYLELGNVRLVKEEADRLGLTTKERLSANGKRSGGRPMSRGYLYKLLGNPLYVGRIAHRGHEFEGQHPAIIDTATWEAVQETLSNNGPIMLDRPRATEPSPLTGKLFDETGEALTPTHAVKSGRRYRYYISKRLAEKSTSDDKSGWRLPAREIERIVATSITDLLTNPSRLADVARQNRVATDRIPQLLSAAEGWKEASLELVERIELSKDEIAISLSLPGPEGETLRFTVPTRIRRRGVEMKLVLENGSTTNAKPDPALIKAVARGHRWFEDLATGRVGTLNEIAEREGVGHRYVRQIVSLAFLSPDVTEAILEGTQPVHITAESLTKRTEIPSSWSEQREMLGFD
ncbi:MAG: recombinase family protein [Parvibaculaceae bacterium]